MSDKIGWYELKIKEHEERIYRLEKDVSRLIDQINKIANLFEIHISQKNPHSSAFKV